MTEHSLKGLERFRNPFQKLYGYYFESEEYQDAVTDVYDEMHDNLYISRKDSIQVVRQLKKGMVEKSLKDVKVLLGED